MTRPKTSGGCRMAQPMYPTKQSHNPATITRVLVSHRFVRCFIAVLFTSFRQIIHLEVSLGFNAERIGDTIEKCKHGCNVHRLGYLWLCPAMIP
jgi:hypothetical protein